MKRHAYEEYRALLDSGVKVNQDNIGVRYNAGGASESLIHSSTKNLVSHIGLMNGYKCDSEVEVQKNKTTVGEIDVLLWGHPERLSYAVEAETSPEEGVESDKVEKYVTGTAIDDMMLLNLNDRPEKTLEAAHWCAEQLGLEI